MDFFSKQDFDYFKNVLDTKITSKHPKWLQIRTLLTTDGVFGKTKYWAELFRESKYSISYRNDCQFSGKIRKYTWAKIFLKGYEHSDIFFTVGVGSRLDNSQFELIYKLDCQRKKGLSPYQVKLFDDYLIRNFPNKSYVERIASKDLNQYDWDLLKLETETFINRFKDGYKDLVKIVWPHGMGVKQKVARLCWNNYGWEKPSGLAGKSLNIDHTFESKGYGHEEWLFDLDRMIEGYHYGFIQAFNKGDHYGKTYDLHLYSLRLVGTKSECYWVGRIKNAQVLTKVEQKQVFEIYKKKGWNNDMVKELNDVGVVDRDLEIVSEEEWFNLKFTIDQDTLTIFEEPIFIENPKEEISKGYGRYGLKDLIKSTLSIEKASGKYKFKSGHNPTKTGTAKSVYTKKIVERNLKHKKIQEYMYSQLVVEFGKNKVGTEISTGRGTSIDVVVNQSNCRDWFYEVKTSYSPLVCIREALGQILEYAMFSSNNHADKLIVVGINEPSQSEIEYLKHLRQISGINICYQVFDMESLTLLRTIY